MTAVLTVTQEQIQEFHQTRMQFLRNVLGLDDALVTDLSDLSDFAFNGMPEGSLDFSRPMKELAATWDAWAIARVQELYGITLTTTRVNMIWLLNQIEVSKKALVH